MEITSTLCRAILFLNGVLLINLGSDYLNGMEFNTWPSLNNLFLDSLTSKCSGTNNLCWFAIIPFMAGLYLIIGAIATFAAIFFRRFETGFMLIFVACLHVFQAYYRILAEQLYIEGKAWQASQMQIVLGTLDAISGILIVCKSGAAKGVHDKQHTE